MLPVLTFLFLGGLSVLAEQRDIVAGAFYSARPGGIPEGWQPWILKNVGRHTAYSVVREDNTSAVRAVARASASGLRKEITIDPREYPIIEWRWRVAHIIDEADVAQKKRNDSPARLYVAFAYDIGKVGVVERLKYAVARKIYSDKLPLRAIAYTWANKTAKGSFVPMPYTSWFMQVVVENGASPVNEWLTEERDVLRDYKEAFGENPNKITAIAVMTNTDNLHGDATAWYGDIVFKRGSR